MKSLLNNQDKWYYKVMRITIFLSVVQSIFWLGHFVVYKAFVKFFNVTDPSLLWKARLVFFLLSISFLAANLVSSRSYGTLARAFYTSSAVWMGTLYWLFLASLLSFIVYFAIKLIIPSFDMTKLAIWLMVGALLVSAYGVWNSYQTKVRNITLKLENLPERWKGKKVVLVADTHLGHVRNLGFSRKIAGLIARQQPEAVFIPGDFYDGSVVDFAELAKPFGSIPTTYGTFFAAGNHEEFRPKNMYFEGLKAGGVKVLDSELVELDGLQIIGVGYSDTINPQQQTNILRSLNINPNLPSILIKHVPSHIEAAAAEGISLQLSGHTHTGQVPPGRWITRKIYKGFEYGLNKAGNTQVFTTSGAGTWGPPQRVGTWGEIVVITLE